MSFYPRDSTELIICDRPSCLAHIPGVGHTLHEQRRSASALAYDQGWQLSNHGDVPLDFCSQHVDQTRAVRMDVTRLYDEHGQPVPRQRLA